ncbi:peptidylprolyl isomerase [Chondromyces apiculatus]|nr:peptidylprolyl isomerase [Chondromyces apiculatus]
MTRARCWTLTTLAALSTLALGACSPPPAPPAGDAGAPGDGASPVIASSSASGAAIPNDGGRVAALLAAEHRRSAVEVTPADQQSRDVAVRRAAARALARIGGEGARAGLLRALSDEDGEVVAWAAYGLGFSCKGHEEETVSDLVARALSLHEGAREATGLQPSQAIARAIGRCGAPASEATLVAWLDGPQERALHAVYALGDLAALKLRLREETVVALLNVAAGSAAAPPMTDALYPLGRIEHLPPTVIERAHEVASARLSEAGEGRIFAVRVLGRTGERGAEALGRVLTTPSVFSAAERAEAARSLKRIGAVGQRALAQALPSILPPTEAAALGGAELGPLLTTLEALESAGAARKVLRDLAVLPLPPGALPAVARRLSWIRCTSAVALVDGDVTDALLVGCDVTAATSTTPGSAPAAPASDDAGAAPPPDAGGGGPGAGAIGARAVVQVLGRGQITGGRLAVWRAHALGGDRRARQAALELIGTHPEIEDVADVLAKALASGEDGLTAVAAEVITKQPQRAAEPERRRRGKRRRAAREGAATEDRKPGEGAASLAPSAAVVSALVAALERAAGGNQPELTDALIDAVGALALKQTSGRLEALCRSSYPTTRGRAEKALSLILGKAATCEAASLGDTPRELGAPVRGPVTLVLETEIGEMTLTLEPALAPAAVTRIVELARAGYYDGMVVHRVVPGFVTQFGAPLGDGYGGPPERPPLRCETSPLPFTPLKVGVALSGRDTGSSQLFVMHARAPHLDGQYALIGAATGSWSAFVDGDRIRKVTLRE